MSRVPPLLAALLLVVAGAAATLAAGGAVTAPVEPGDDPVVGVSENTTRVLLLTNADAAQFQSPNASVTDSLDAGYDDFDASLRIETVSERLDAAESQAAKRAILDNATTWAAERVASLREREQNARAAFAAGESSAREYVTQLGVIHAEAESLRNYLGRPTTDETLYAYAIIDDATRTRISHLRAQLATVQGPVRDRVADVVTGDRDSLRVHVAVGDGVMLSTIDGQYVRETYRPGNLDPEVANSVPDVRGIVQEFYPWVWNNSGGPSTRLLRGYAFESSVDHTHGRLVAYIDPTTERVFVERQWKSLSQHPVDVEATASANNTTMLVSRTYTGGPVQVRVENSTGAPVDATVALNGTEVGSTGPDGKLWLLSPAGEYAVAATFEDVELEVNVTARPAP
ncbi:DUF7096 domain-containing protein [Halobacterium wangiae]|uniref:DUF7096 domain-containing protein n=1 Tax=Halobacterium wangiae TaxID=2902623 RepID=UPI001E470F7A|nr:hypothetical protein [Halobacterium wangiae]